MVVVHYDNKPISQYFVHGRCDDNENIIQMTLAVICFLKLFALHNDLRIKIS